MGKLMSSVLPCPFSHIHLFLYSASTLPQFVMSCHGAVPIIDPHCLCAPPTAVCCPLLLCSALLPATSYLTLVLRALLLANKFSWGYCIVALHPPHYVLCPNFVFLCHSLTGKPQWPCKVSVSSFCQSFAVHFLFTSLITYNGVLFLLVIYHQASKPSLFQASWDAFKLVDLF